MANPSADAAYAGWTDTDFLAAILNELRATRAAAAGLAPSLLAEPPGDLAELLDQAAVDAREIDPGAKTAREILADRTLRGLPAQAPEPRR